MGGPLARRLRDAITRAEASAWAVYRFAEESPGISAISLSQLLDAMAP